MPATTVITDAYKYTYEMNIRHAVQQAKSKLEPFVEKGKIEGERLFMDTLAAHDPSEITTRFATVTYNDTEWERRSVALRWWYDALKVDPKDIVYMLTNPMSKLVMNTKMGMARKKDAVIYEAFDATVKLGKSFDTDQAFDSNNVITCSGGLTYAKVLELKQGFAENNLEDEEIYCVISPAVESQLWAINQFISADYRNGKPVENGVLGRILNVNFITYNSVTTASGVAKCFAWVKPGIQFGLSEDVKVRTGEIEEQHYAPYVYTSMACNAIRVDEDYVFQLNVAV